jgi:hypothetical protein
VSSASKALDAAITEARETFRSRSQERRIRIQRGEAMTALTAVPARTTREAFVDLMLTGVAVVEVKP